LLILISILHLSPAEASYFGKHVVFFLYYGCCIKGQRT
jgi:hypothetical protein